MTLTQRTRAGVLRINCSIIYIIGILPRVNESLHSSNSPEEQRRKSDRAKRRHDEAARRIPIVALIDLIARRESAEEERKRSISCNKTGECANEWRRERPADGCCGIIGPKYF